MNNSLQANNHITQLESTVSRRGLRPGKAFRRHCAALRYTAACRDLETIRTEALASRPKSWAEQI